MKSNNPLYSLPLRSSCSLRLYKLTPQTPFASLSTAEKNELAYINADYTKRLEPKQAIAALKKLSDSVSV